MPRHIGSTHGEFAVCQFFVSGEHEYTRAWVDISEALEAFQHYTTSVAVKLGFVTKVIIADGMDCTVALWTPEGGIQLFDQPDPEPEEDNLKGRKDRELDADWDPEQEQQSR